MGRGRGVEEEKEELTFSLESGKAILSKVNKQK